MKPVIAGKVHRDENFTDFATRIEQENFPVLVAAFLADFRCNSSLNSPDRLDALEKDLEAVSPNGLALRAMREARRQLAQQLAGN